MKRDDLPCVVLHGPRLSRKEVEILSVCPYDHPAPLTTKERAVASKLRLQGLIEKDPTGRGASARWMVTDDGQSVVDAYRRKGWLK